MRRRNSQLDDPLDLLLDTICNLFGVVIFVAILAALLAGRPDLPKSIELVSIPAIEIRILEIESIERITADRGIASGEAEVNRRQDRLDIQRTQLERLRLDTAAAASLATLLQAENEALELELRAETDAKNVQLRTPRQRELAEMLPAQIVISNRRAYVVNDWSRVSRSNVIAERCVGWTTWNPDAVDENTSTAIIHHCYRAGGQDIEIWLHADFNTTSKSFREDRSLKTASWKEWRPHSDAVPEAPATHGTKLKTPPFSSAIC